MKFNKDEWFIKITANYETWGAQITLNNILDENKSIYGYINIQNTVLNCGCINLQHINNWSLKYDWYIVDKYNFKRLFYILDDEEFTSAVIEMFKEDIYKIVNGFKKEQERFLSPSESTTIKDVSEIVDIDLFHIENVVNFEEFKLFISYFSEHISKYKTLKECYNAWILFTNSMKKAVDSNN